MRLPSKVTAKYAAVLQVADWVAAAIEDHGTETLAM